MKLKLHNFIDDVIDELQEDTITTICGPPNCGKTTLCYHYINESLNQGKKVIFIDTEGGFSPERLKQINSNINLKNILVLSPKSFEEQQKTMQNLNKQIRSNKNIGLIIVDSLVMLYRLKLGDAPQKVNSELGEQLRLLTEISRKFKIPILITNQIYKDFETKEIKMVGGLVIEYWSKIIVEIVKDIDLKKIVLRKHKFKECNKSFVEFEIKRDGIHKLKRSFSLFKINK